MPFVHKNFAYSTIATAPVPAASGTSLTVQAGEAANFPASGWVVVWPAGAQPLVSNAEVCFFVPTGGDTLGLIRAQQGTVARTIIVGDQISAPLTIGDMRAAEGYQVSDSFYEYLPPSYYKVVAAEFDIPAGATLEIDAGAVLEII